MSTQEHSNGFKASIKQAHPSVTQERLGKISDLSAWLFSKQEHAGVVFDTLLESRHRLCL